MAKINFPAASESPWYNPDNGVTYEYIDGTWRTVTTASQLDDIYVKEIGDTMTGELILHGNPAQELGATPKQYVDTEITNAISSSESGETGRLDGRYLRKDSGGGNQIVTSNGTTTFNGLVESGDGVKVTGGNPNTIVSGVCGTNNGSGSLFFVANNRIPFELSPAGRAVFRMADKEDSGIVFGIQTSGDVPAGVTDIYSVYENAGCSNTFSGKFNSFFAGGTAIKGTPSEAVGFVASENLADKGTINIGFRSDLGTSTGNDYNFYAKGNAPNYLAGELRIGTLALANDPATGTTTGTIITGGAGGHFKVGRNSATDTTSIQILNRSGSSTGRILEFRENGTFADSISLDGSGGVTFGTSDYRLKENIVDLPSATETIKSLRPVNYNFKSHPGKTRPGFIAHEVSETLPVAVTGEKDATEAIGTLVDYDGTILETEVTEPNVLELEYTEEVETDGVATMITRTRTWTATGTRPVYQSVDQIKLIPLLTKALQEALERIEALEADHATMMNNNGSY